MEAVVSLLILSILLTTIVSIIRFSTAMTGDALADATAAQERMNRLILGEYEESDPKELTFKFKSSDESIVIEAAHSVDYNTEAGIVAFSPSD